jgi:hypothetical protein
MLTDQSYASLFGPGSAALYLNTTLVPQGTLLTDYYASAHAALADGIALLSGQGPTTAQQANCPTYEPLSPATAYRKTGTVRGHGCVFPAKVETLPGELVAHHHTWRAYIAGQGAPGDVSSSCRHPHLGAADPTAATETPADGYLTWRNPFVYFRSLSKEPKCAADDAGLGQLGPDLAGGNIPTLSWIAPDLCTAGDPAACPATGTPPPSSTISPAPSVSGAAAADAFLSQWIPQIEATAAYHRNGMIVILSDQAPASGAGADSNACCGKIHYPNAPNPGGASTPGPGGGRVGALVISPFAAKGVTDPTESDHYTLLRTLETIFHLPHLGYSAKRQPFGQTVFPSESGGNNTGPTTT